MPFILEKNISQKLTISKLRIGLGWEPNYDESVHPFDLDVSAFLLGKKGKLVNDEYLVFYNSDRRVLPNKLMKVESHDEAKYPAYIDEEGKEVSSYENWRRCTRPVDPEFSVFGSIDDMDGEVSDGGDDETMNIHLEKLTVQVEEIVIVASIYDYIKRDYQNFGQVDDSYISIYNELSNSPEPIYKYELNEDFSEDSAIEFVRIFRDGASWKVEALGIGHQDGLQSIINKYY
jgi:tellurium resistance protein TerD